MTARTACELSTRPTADHDRSEAAAAFRRRYGTPPRYAFLVLGGLLLVGPAPAPAASLVVINTGALPAGEVLQ